MSVVALKMHLASEPRGIRNELVLLRTRWYIILGCLCFQYVHGIFTQLAYRMHSPAQGPLHDVGFAVLPELPSEWRWLSEALFTFLFISFILWTFVPLVAPRKFSCVLLWTRLLIVLVVCQSLRIVSFPSTQLPGPAPHCRLGTPTAYRAPVAHWWQHVVVDVSRQVANSCGDLIFSSHMTFILMGVLSYQHYGGTRIIKSLAWASAVVLALLIIAARQHYTVDVVIAWYTVPLVYCCLNMYWHMQGQRQQLGEAATEGSTCAVHGAGCSSCTGCYSPYKKLQLPERAFAADQITKAKSPTYRLPHVSYKPTAERVLSADEVDALIDVPSESFALKSPSAATLNSARSPAARRPNPNPSSPSWASGLAAVWIFGHRRLGSGSSNSSSSSHDSLGMHSPLSFMGGAGSAEQFGDDSSAV